MSLFYADEPKKLRATLVQVSPEHCRAARAWLGWTQAELAQRANIGLSAVKDFEKGNRRTLPAIRAQMQRAFEQAGVTFLPRGIEAADLPAGSGLGTS